MRQDARAMEYLFAVSAHVTTDVRSQRRTGTGLRIQRQAASVADMVWVVAVVVRRLARVGNGGNCDETSV